MAKADGAAITDADIKWFAATFSMKYSILFKYEVKTYICRQNPGPLSYRSNALLQSYLITQLNVHVIHTNCPWYNVYLLHAQSI